MLRTIVLAVTLAGLSGTGYAYEKFGPYAGIGAGRSQATVELDTGVNFFTIDADDQAWRAFAG